MSKMIDLTGQQFGRLTVINRAEDYVSPKGHKLVQWLCECECGNKTIVTTSCLRGGQTQSCGCINREISRKRLLTHGDSDSRLYKIWASMRERCRNSSDKNYRHYGGRGIFVCDEWDNYVTFKEWALSSGYREDLTIDRIDVNGNYEPSNCRWVTIDIQANNRRNNHYITYNNKTQSMKDWSNEIGINYSALRRRIQAGWSPEKAFNTPIETKEPVKIEYNGVTQTIGDWARKMGIPHSTIANRLEKGWSVEKALTTTDDARLKQITYNGKTQSIKDWADELGVNPNGLYTRIKNYGWSAEKALATPFREKDIPIEFNGEARTMAEWAKYLGMQWSTLYSRIVRKKWSIEKALTTPVKGRKRCVNE